MTQKPEKKTYGTTSQGGFMPQTTTILKTKSKGFSSPMIIE